MTIAPDDKDWTWVLERPCPDCGFDARGLDVDRVGEEITANAATWQDVLARADATRRPTTDRWSPLEYGCHVRDVYRIFDERLRLMLTADDPLFENWDQDATAVEDRYADQDPPVVAAELTRAGHTIAARFGRVKPDEWRRPGRRSDGSVFTVDSLARYLLHDPIHHLWDVGVPPS